VRCTTDFRLSRLKQGGSAHSRSRQRRLRWPIKTTSSSAFIKNFKPIAEEGTAYSEKSLEKVLAFLQELRSAKSFESAVHINSEYTKTFFADFAAYLTKIGELYANLSKEVLKPIEAVVAKVQSGKKWADIEGNWKPPERSRRSGVS
jgi:hypothetical protein